MGWGRSVLWFFSVPSQHKFSVPNQPSLQIFRAKSTILSSFSVPSQHKFSIPSQPPLSCRVNHCGGGGNNCSAQFTQNNNRCQSKQYCLQIFPVQKVKGCVKNYYPTPTSCFKILKNIKMFLLFIEIHSYEGVTFDMRKDTLSIFRGNYLLLFCRL